MQAPNANAQPLSPAQPHFAVLDGLRGVAALAIVLFHFTEWIYPDARQNPVAHSFLAVDFFFCLSGFVIGYAYDQRIRQLGTAAFFRRRLIRLHPLVVLGSLLGLLALVLDPFVPPSPQTGTTLGLSLICSLSLVPLPILKERAYNLFGLNAPAWSLFWEYVASVGYALLLHRLSRRWLAAWLLVAAAALVGVSYRAGNLLGGWAGVNFWDGGARVAYSFVAGLLLYRLKWILSNDLGFEGLSILLGLVFLLPLTRWNWLLEPLVVGLYFPLLIALGAGTRLSPTLKSLCGLLGRLSYPLYMTHYAGLWLFGHYLAQVHPAPLDQWLVTGAGLVGLVGLSYLVLLVYDAPVRAYLTRRELAKEA